MNYLIDTDWVVDYLRGRPDAIWLHASFSGDDVAISIVTYGEVYDGIEQSADPAAEVGFRLFLHEVAVRPLGKHIIRQFFRTRRDLRRRGIPLEDPDLLIAATALHHDLTLVTRNRRHFERVPGLKLHS